MLQKIARQIIYPFSSSQNFFEMNPVYPDMGEKDFDLYNSSRKKIKALDKMAGEEQRRKLIQNLVKKKIYIKKYDKFKKFSGSTNFREDPQTHLLVGLDSDFDQFIKQFKANKLVTKNAKSQFKTALLNLVHKFNCKSQPELIRLFRIQLTHSKRKSLLDKLRGKILQEALLKTTALRKISPLKDGNQEAQEEEFQKILKELDEKIQLVQDSLRLNQYGIPNNMSRYHEKYGWEISMQKIDNQNYDRTSGVGSPYLRKMQAYDNGNSFQDQSIKARINRLYFLRRLQLLKKQNTNHARLLQDLPINLKQRQNMMNQIAYKYKEEELVQEPDLQQIYKQVDIVIDKIFIKVSPSHEKSNNHQGEELFDHGPGTRSYLWENINAQEILCSDQYNYETIKSTPLSEKSVKQISPHPDVEISLANIPFNLYKHSEFEIFGIYNQHRLRSINDYFSVTQTDFQPQFKYFNIQEAQKQYEQMERKVKEGQQTSYATAKRKKSECEVFVTKGNGLVTVNGKPIQDYFADVYYRVQALKPLLYTDTSGFYDLKFNVAGSGFSGQSNCMSLALSRALMKINPQHRQILSCFGMDGYDTRIKEAKKKNLYSARVRPPYVRR